MEPSITDWIQAIGILLTFPTAAWGIFSLFKKDKYREEEVDALKALAKGQVDSLIQLEIQVQELKYQSSIYEESNRLLKDQIRIQNEAFLNDSSYKEKMLESQAKQRKSDIKPNFIFTSGMMGNLFNLHLKNIGNTAITKEIFQEESTATVYLNALSFDWHIQKGEEFVFSGTTRSGRNLLDLKVDFRFTDIDGNLYSQEILTVGGRTTISTIQEVI